MLRRLAVLLVSGWLVFAIVGCGRRNTEENRIERLKRTEQEGRGLSRKQQELLREAEEETAQQQEAAQGQAQ